MRQIIRSGRRGRPQGPCPLFVEDCAVRFDATEHLAKTRGSAVEDGVAWTRVNVTWTEDGQPRTLSVVLGVTSTAQRLGGARRWWECPGCRRRRRILFLETMDSPLPLCRRCLYAGYSSDYPARHKLRELRTLLTGFVSDGSQRIHEQWERELTALRAKRRRGVRRGRRIRERVERLSERMTKESDAVMSLITDYSGWK
jgi:hypothetical protein